MQRILEKTGVPIGAKRPGLSKRMAIPSLHKNIKPVVARPPAAKSKKRPDSDDDGEEFITPEEAARRKKALEDGSDIEMPAVAKYDSGDEDVAAVGYTSD